MPDAVDKALRVVRGENSSDLPVGDGFPGIVNLPQYSVDGEPRPILEHVFLELESNACPFANESKPDTFPLPNRSQNDCALRQQHTAIDDVRRDYNGPEL